MDQCFLYHCGFNYEAIKDREWNFEANGCARPAVFAWNLLPHQHLLTRLGKEMDELTRLAEVDCLLTHLKMLSFLRKEDLDWGVSLLQVDNQEATKAEIRWQADYTILWWIFWVRKDRAKKKSVPGPQLCVLCLHRKLHGPISFMTRDLVTSEGFLGSSLMTLMIRI